MDSAKQSAALCLLRLYRTSPHLVPTGDWASRVVHLLNDQHLVSALDEPAPQSPQQEEPCDTARVAAHVSGWPPSAPVGPPLPG